MQVMRRGPSFDWWLFILALLLSVSGLIYVYSATWVATDPPGPYFAEDFTKQVLFLVAALVMFFLLRRINWGLRPDSWIWFYLPVMMLLILLIFVGSDHDTGAIRWIDLGVISIQPSEFAKLGLTLILAWLYSGEAYKVRRRFWSALAIMLSMLALVAIQPDLGTSLVFLIIFFVMSLFAAVPRRWLVAVYLVFFLLMIPVWFMLRDYQKNRILVFVGLEINEDRQLVAASSTRAGYHIIQSENAIGAGGLTGQGFLRGTQVHGGFIPVVMSDFIFTVVGEEFGFIGCAWLLLLYFLLLARILALSRDALSLYERYICYGASAVIFFHVFIAVGMTIRLAPITGLPLPFVSYGGSALMTMWLLMAILQSIYANSRRDFRTARPRN
jgi:rod shape determining protein RodA